MAAQFQFTMRSGPTIGRVYSLEGQEISIGRDVTNIISINDAEVSRKHARMELRGSTYMIQDLGSTNGTFVNGTRISGMQVLNTGDSVSFGEGIVLVYETVGDVNATVLSAKVPSAAVPPTTVQKPVQTPTPAPTPIPVYSGQVPAGPVPVPMPPAEPPKKKKFSVWVIIVILLLLVICACVAFFVIIDQFSLWCEVVPFLVPLLGGTC